MKPHSILLVLLLAAFSRAQPTYQPHCGCEYIVDGKCAYTLLIPITSDSTPASSCPAHNAPDLSANLTKLAENLSETRGHVTQLQAALINVQNRVLNETALVGQLSAQQDRLLTFKDNLDQMFLALNDVVSGLEESHDHRHDEMDNLEQRITSLGLAHNQTVVRLSQVESELAQLKQQQGSGLGETCRRGLLVTGAEKELPLEQIQVSSMYDSTHGTPKVRINAEGRPGSWCAFEPASDYEWVQFDLGAAGTPVLGVVTRGRPDFPQWVTSYKLQYADELIEGDEQAGWTVYKDVVGLDMTFAGNSDSNTPQVHMLWQPIHARYIRIWPLTFEKNFCMRADVIGCIDS